ncbi:hypothetical protein Tco_0092657 [Tanacetum coccineum]
MNISTIVFKFHNTVYNGTKKMCIRAEGSSETTTDSGTWRTIRIVLTRNILGSTECEAEAGSDHSHMVNQSMLKILEPILLGIGKFTSRDGESLESYYSSSYFNFNHNGKAARNRGKAIVNSSAPIYDQEPAMVTDDDEMTKEMEIDKLMALISLSFKKIYKPTNNNLRTSSNTKQADWKDDTDDESDDQELEAYYMYMAQIQEVTPDPVDNSRPIFDAEPLHKDDQDDTDELDQERDLLASLIEKLKCEIDDSKNQLRKFLSGNIDKIVDMNYASKVAIDCAKAKGDLMSYKIESEKLSREYYYADHMNAILGVYTDLDEATNLQCDYLETLEKLQRKDKNDKSFKENQSKEFLKEREQYFEIEDLKAQFQDKGIVISELNEHFIEKDESENLVDTFENHQLFGTTD